MQTGIHEDEIPDGIVDEDTEASTTDAEDKESSAQRDFMNNVQLTQEQKDQIIQYVHDLKIKERCK